MQENPYQPPRTLSTPDELLLREAHDSTGDKPRLWTVFAALVSAIAGALFLSVVFAIVAVAWMVSTGHSLEEVDATVDGFMESPLGYAVIMLVNQLPVFTVAWTAAWLSPVPIARRLDLLPSGLSPLQFAMVVLGVGMPFFVGVGLTQALSDFI